MLRTDGATAAVGYSSPPPWPPDSHGQLALPPGWKVSKDQRGVQYYYNKELKVTQWNRPETAHQSRQIPQGAVSPPMSPPPPHNGRYSEGTPSIASRSHSRKSMSPPPSPAPPQMMTPPLQTNRPTFDAIPPTAHHSEDWAQHHRKDFRGAHSHGYVDTMNDQKLQFFTIEEIDHIVDDLCCEYAPGKLTPDQFREAINDLNLNFDISVKNEKSFSMWMEILDADGDGYVDMKEFQKFYHCVILQRRFRNRRSGARMRFHCNYLSKRLLLQQNIISGAFRLINQGLIFMFLLVALSFQGQPSVRRGVYDQMAGAMNFPQILGTKLKSNFVDYLPTISDISKNYFLTSSRYFDAGPSGAVSLLQSMESFSSPRLLGGIDLTIQAPEFSFSAWVSTTPQFVRGYIIRKRLVSSGDGESLPCWGWYIDKAKGQMLRFGAHDMFPTDPDLTKKNERQLDVGLDPPQAFEPNEFFLLTMVVNTTHVTFYQNLRLLGLGKMQRRITDCFNNFEGVLLGSAGMIVSQLRFYPTALTTSNIEEIMVFGSRLSDIASGSQPFEAGEDSLDATGRSLEVSIDGVNTAVEGRQTLVEISQIAQAVEAQPSTSYASPTMPSGEYVAESWKSTGVYAPDPHNADHILKNDTKDGPQYYQLVTGPYSLGQIPEDQMRYLTHMPDWENTGSTWSFWYRHIKCLAPTCGGYLFMSGDFLRAQAMGIDRHQYWGLWVENEGIWIDAPGRGYYWFVDFDGAPKFNLNSPSVWRHIALQWDEQHDKINFYLDGVLAFFEENLDASGGHRRAGGTHSSPIHKLGTAADVDNDGEFYPTAMTMGHANPGYSQSIPFCEIADLRLYVHGSKGPLTQHEVHDIAFGTTTAVLDPEYKCLEVTSEKMRDQVWQDTYGHDCSWFFKAKDTNPEVCNLKKPSSQCPISCGSRQECYTKPDELVAKVKFVFDGIQRIDSVHENGTVCLGRHGGASRSTKRRSQSIDGFATSTGVRRDGKRRKGGGGTIGKTKTTSGGGSSVAGGGGGGGTGFFGEAPPPSVGSEEKNKVVQACRKNQWKEGDPELEWWLDSMYTSADERADGCGREGRRLNLTDCDQLEEAIDEYCIFDLDPVEEWTRDVIEHGGHYSLGFWVKPLGDESLMEGKFFPHILFYGSVSPPQQQLSLLKSAGGVFGQFNQYSKCSRGGYYACKCYWLTELSTFPSNSGWTFFAYTSTNATEDHTTQKFTSQTNLGSRVDSVDFPTCLFNEQSFFTAIEVNYPMLISPIMMVPKAMPTATLQALYLKHYPDMAIRIGPLTPNSETETTTVPISKNDFTNHATLLAPPILFQTRGRRAECTFNYSASFIQNEFRKATSGKCKYPFQCGYLEPQSLISCSESDTNSNETHFGLNPMTFQSNVGYSDFLYTIADNEYVYRDDSLSSTSSFIDSLTRTIQVVLLFYVPGSGLVTMLNIKADMSGTQDATTRIEVDHYGIVDGETLSTYMICQFIVISQIVFMLLDVFLAGRKIVSALLRREYVPLQAFAEPFSDLFCAVFISVYIAFRVQSCSNSARDVSDILGKLDKIPWSDAQTALTQKQASFFALVEKLTKLVEWDVQLDSLCTIILFIQLLRIIHCTKVHPRLALLTGALYHAFDDLWHTAILTCALMCCFGGIAAWRFGSYLEEFATFEQTLITEFMMLFGTVDYFNWGTNPQMPRAGMEMKFWAVLYLLVIFLLVLNFILAIVVDAYMKVREEIEKNPTEMDFITDLKESVIATSLGFWYGWPHAQALGEILSEWQAKNSVGHHELDGINMFRSYKAVTAFLKFYSRYDFLEPPSVDMYGLSPEFSNVCNMQGRLEKSDSAYIIQTIDRGFAKHNRSQKNFPSLKEELLSALLTVAQRRQSTGHTDQAVEILSLRNSLISIIQARKRATDLPPSADDIRKWEKIERRELYKEASELLTRPDLPPVSRVLAGSRVKPVEHSLIPPSPCFLR